MKFEQRPSGERYTLRCYVALGSTFAIKERSVIGREEAYSTARYLAAGYAGVCVIDRHGTTLATFGTIPQA